MATIRSISQHKYRADVRKHLVSIQSKTFPTEKKAIKWAEDIESNIETILSLSRMQLKKITPDNYSKL